MAALALPATDAAAEFASSRELLAALSALDSVLGRKGNER
jgi:hypothetical protein